MQTRLHSDSCDDGSVAEGGCGCKCELLPAEDPSATENLQQDPLPPDQAESLLGDAIQELLSTPECAGADWAGGRCGLPRPRSASCTTHSCARAPPPGGLLPPVSLQNTQSYHVPPPTHPPTRSGG